MQEVEAAFLQSGTMIHGVSQTETTINDNRVKGVKMFWEGHTLTVTVKNKSTVIPLTNIKAMWVKPIEVKAETKKAK